MTNSQPAPTAKPQRYSAAEFIAAVVDTDSFQSWDAPANQGHTDAAYKQALEQAAEKSGQDEAICTGTARIGGHEVALIVSEFNFLGGSIGYATAQRIIHAIERATAEKLPLIAAPSSGGTRMQEGTPAFALMTAITAAVFHHKDAHLPYLVYLRHPTTGGVLASWGSAGHIIFSQPQALIGFLGPRVVELTTGHPMPEGIQQAEHLVSCGLHDATVPVPELAGKLQQFLDILYGPTAELADATPTAPSDSTVSAAADPTIPANTVRPADYIDPWEAIERTRQPNRPSSSDLLAALADTHVLPLSGSGEGRASAALRLALVRLESGPAVFIGQDRTQQPPLGDAWLDTAALRCARRGISLAQQLNIPLISVVDTPGAELSAAAETSGLANSIAKTLHDLLSADIPTLTVLLGQGCGGGALAMLPADVILATEASWLSPLPPEGASAILYRDTSHAPELMRHQQVGAPALAAAGLINGLIPETDDLCATTWAAINAQLAALADAGEIDHQATRLARYTALANPQ